MIRRTAIYSLLLCLFLCCAADWPPHHKARVRLKVVDEDANVVTNAKVSIGFSTELGRGGATSFSGRSNGEGEYEATARCDGDVGYTVRKEGHYPCSGEVHFSATNVLAGQWQPWGVTVTVLLKRVIGPAAMYAKRVSLELPVRDVSVGYDLVIGDWLPPHGDGIHPDLAFLSRDEDLGPQAFISSLVVRFANPGDGLLPFVGSGCGWGSLKSDHEAPDGGYVGGWTQRWTRASDGVEKTNRDRQRNYYIRVRTVLDEKGDVVKAMYGKIYGDFMQFHYYLNPDGTRNVEFDPKQNLLKGLKGYETPQMP